MKGGVLSRIGVVLAGVVAASVMIQAEAQAFSGYVSLVPTSFSCSTCHFNPRGGGSRNPFGVAFSGNGYTWAAIFNLDSDGDGFTNGQELNDPDGMWRQGQPLPGGTKTRPGDPADFPVLGDCGNNALDEGEDCDGALLDGATCVGEGFDRGTISCRNDCTLNTSACERCGDNVRSPGEECEGANLNGATCQSEGFDGGTLRCFAGCTLDTALCTTCGNGMLEDGESCEGDDIGGATCEGEGFGGGVLTCADCALDTSACEPAENNVCGDGVKRNDEACDGEDLGDSTCAGAVSGSVGELGCNEDCTLNTDACTLCGNSIIDEGERCEGFELGGATCEGEGFLGGALGCNEDCSLDTSSCEAAPTSCGNGTIDEGEDCDGENVGGGVCADFAPGTVGTVACKSDCTIDIAGCTDSEGEPEAQPEVVAPAPKDDEGCAVSPGRSNGALVWASLLLGALFLARRRRD